METSTVYWGAIGIMQERKEATIVYQGYIEFLNFLARSRCVKNVRGDCPGIIGVPIGDYAGNDWEPPTPM